MKIKSINIKNFRNFRSIKIDELNPKVNVIVGINGAGKTAILDALSIASSTLLSKIPTASSKNITKEDVRLISKKTGSVVDTQKIFPVVISACGYNDGLKLEWSRELNGEKSKTTTKNATNVINLGESFKSLIQSSEDITLPILAHYDTGRLHRAKTQWGKTLSRKNSRLDGYIDAVSSGTNAAQLYSWLEKMTLLQIQSGESIPELSAVLSAIEAFYSAGNDHISNVKAYYSINYGEPVISYMVNNIEKLDEPEYVELPLHMLSDGTRIILTMVAEIAHRMAKLNPHLFKNVLESPGMVLIDEIDMHLHPSWQSRIIDTLTATFPNVQFIATTHSPVVISNTPKNSLFILDGTEGSITSTKYSYGHEVSHILDKVMGTNKRPKEVLAKFDRVAELIDENELSEASELLGELRVQLGNDDADIIRNQTSIDIEKMLGD